MNRATELLNNGAAFLSQGNAREALICFTSVLQIAPGSSVAHLFSGAALHELGQYEEAVASYQNCIEISPEDGEAYNNLGNSLLALHRYAEAASCFSAAADLLSHSPVPLAASATALQACGKIAEAEAACRKALLVDPGFASAHWNLALNLLLQGRYKEGWQEYEWRWQRDKFTSPKRHTDIPRWDGTSFNGGTVLLHAEQGFGDTIQFVRYLPLVAKLGGKVVLECHPELLELLQQVSGAEVVVPFGAKLPQADFQAPLLSLPALFETAIETIPADCPYIKVTDDKRKRWGDLLKPQSDWRIKVGLAWAGKSYPDPLRSVPVEELAPLATVVGVQLYSLQVGSISPGGEMPLVDLTGEITDFSDTAALIEQLDLIITIDTAVAHLAGALGKPLFIMLPYAPDWRWLLERSDSPWYRSAKLFRQPGQGRWGEVVLEIRRALINLENQFNTETQRAQRINIR